MFSSVFQFSESWLVTASLQVVPTTPDLVPSEYCNWKPQTWPRSAQASIPVTMSPVSHAVTQYAEPPVPPAVRREVSNGDVFTSQLSAEARPESEIAARRATEAVVMKEGMMKA
jgi:hypothetical protein